ncbi:MAG: serine/threonine-protein kinase [Sandaracinaceae bacterium]
MADEESGEPDEDDLSGQVFGNYRVLSRLGEGGMGAVYLAHHQLIDKQVVIKVLHPEMAKRPEFVERFHREAKAATSIGHEHIVDVTDMGQLPDGSPFIVMEYLEGRSLGDLLLDEGALPIGRAIRLVQQVCDALAAAHDKGIIHRDMKPDNVLVLERRGEDFVKVLDFGISKFLADEEQIKLTQTGMAMGTPSYMSPEQTQGLDTVDHRTDLYAVGVMLYELLSGDVPFTASTYAALILKAVTEPPPPLREARPDVPETLEAVVLSALAKKPEGRPADLRVLSDALAPFSSLDAPAPASLSSAPGESTGPLGPGWTKGPTLLANSAAELPTERPGANDAALPATRAAIELDPPLGGPISRSSLEDTALPEPSERSESSVEPEAERVTGRASRGLWIGAGLVAAALVGGLILWNRAPAPTPPPPAPEEVHVRIRVAPADATVEIDGVRFDNPVEAQRLRSLSPVRLRIQHPGYEPVERMVVFDEDRAYDIQLAPVAASPPDAGISVSDAGAPEEEPAPEPTAARPPREEPDPDGRPSRQGIYRGRRTVLRDDF